MVDPGQAARVAFPNAKINVGLQVRSRRADGFHELDSLFLPIPWRDSLEIATPGSGHDITLHLAGNAIAGATEDNLIVRAYRLLQRDFAVPPCDFHLVKAIPSGAGLGGGSADGTTALVLLNQHFSLGLSTAQLESLAGELGSDCPFFVRNAPARVTGRGDVLSPIDLDLDGWHIALLHPGIHVPTGAAFSWVTPSDDRPGLDQWAGSGPEDWRGQLENDFTAPVCQRHPEVRQALNLMVESGARFADMSGSGSTVYGFFRDVPEWADLPEQWVHWSGTMAE